MFGIGMPEMILILAIALIVIGPHKLPELAKSMGRAINEFRKATHDLKESMEIDTEFKDVKKAFDEMNDDIKGAIEANPESGDKISDKHMKADGQETESVEKTGGAKSDQQTPEIVEATHDLKESMEIDTEFKDVKKAFDEMNDDIKEAIETNPESGDKHVKADGQKTESVEKTGGAKSDQQTPEIVEKTEGEIRKKSAGESAKI